MKDKLNITNKWDKTFKLSDKVNHKKVTFHTRFGFTLVADLYEPKEYKKNYQQYLYVGHLVL